MEAFHRSKKNLGIKKVYDLSNGKKYSLKLPQVGKRRELRTMIGLRKYIYGQFKPNVGKMFYDMNGKKQFLIFLWDGVIDWAIVLKVKLLNIM